MADTNDDDDSEEIESSGNAIEEEEGEEENQSDQEEEESVDSIFDDDIFDDDDDDESDDVVGDEMIHPSIKAAISWIRIPAAGNGDSNSNKHNLLINGYGERPIDRHSLEYLVNFLDGGSHEVVISELELEGIQLNYEPYDGGLNVLRDFFARSDTTLTKVYLSSCYFGITEDASRLLTAFQTNRTVSDLEIRRIQNLEGDGVALGACLANLMQNMPQLQRLDSSGCVLSVEGVRVFQPALQANRTLKQLYFTNCYLADEGIHLIADALVGNTTIEVLNISSNTMTSNGLDDITRLIESTRLKSISLGYNAGIFNDEASTRRFARILSRHDCLKKLNLCQCQLGDKGIHLIADGLVGNTTMEILDIQANDISSRGLADNDYSCRRN